MIYCSNCGARVVEKVPSGDDRTRFVCEACATIHYQNPKIVAGCIPEWDGRLLLWRRYNGAWWSRANPANDGKDHRTFEALVEAGVPELAAFGESYRLFYDQLPDYAGS